MRSHRRSSLPVSLALSLAFACGGGEPAAEPDPDLAQPGDSAAALEASPAADVGVPDPEVPNPEVPVEWVEPMDLVEAEGPSIDGLRDLVSPGEFKYFIESRGLVTATEAATEGYTLVMPLNSTQIHLVDLEGTPQHTWETGLGPGGWCYLADDGTLYRSARQDDDPKFRGGGIGGIIQRLAPDGEELWRFEFANAAHCQHHDIEVLPNGNVLFIAWERHSAAEAIAHGRDPRGVGAQGLWTDALIEVRPTLPVGGEIVWSWHAWDHLVQNVDEHKPSHGALAEHPGRLDINANFEAPAEDEGEADSSSRKDWDKSGDWLHTNAIDYHPDLDLLVLSSPELCEIFVIDHSTTSEEAAGDAGGRWGHGGDLLWRWGNPSRYGRGGVGDQRLFYQHDAQWLRTPEGLKLTVFNNGGDRPDGSSFSEVLELSLPFQIDTGFAGQDGEAFGPAQPDWTYANPESFYSAFTSGASRLPGGNTLVCSGVAGRIFEVTPEGEVVWDYYSPFGGDIEPPDHAGNAPPFALYRAARYAPDHPGVAALR